MSDARALIDAEDPKDFLKRVAAKGWRIKPIDDGVARHAVTAYYDGEEQHNIIIDQGKEHAKALEDYLNWLLPRHPYTDTAKGCWIPDFYIHKADLAGWPEEYIKATGKPAFKRSGKTGLRMTTDPNEPRSEPPGQIWASLPEAEDPKHFLKHIAKGTMVIYMCPFTDVGAGDTEPHWEYYGGDEESWTPDISKAQPERLSDLVKDGVLDLNDMPLGTEQVLELKPDGSPGRIIPVNDLKTRYTLVDTYRSPEEPEVDWDGPGVFEAEDPKSVFRKAIDASTLTPDKIREARRRIKEAYGSLRFSTVTIESAAMRTGTEHEEENVNGQWVCKVCGPVEDDNNLMKIDPIFHPEIWLPSDLGEAEDPKEFLRSRSRVRHQWLGNGDDLFDVEGYYLRFHNARLTGSELGANPRMAYILLRAAADEFHRRYAAHPGGGWHMMEICELNVSHVDRPAMKSAQERVEAEGAVKNMNLAGFATTSYSVTRKQEEAEDPKQFLKLQAPRPGYLVFWTKDYHVPGGQILYLDDEGSWTDLEHAQVHRLTNWLTDSGEWRTDDFPAETLGIVLTNWRGIPEDEDSIYTIDQLHRIDTTYFLQMDPKPLRYADDDAWEQIGPVGEAEDPKAFLKRTAPRPKWVIKAETTNGRVFMEKSGKYSIISWHVYVRPDTAQYDTEEQARADMEGFLKPEIINRHMIVPFQLTPENIKAENVQFVESEDPKRFLQQHGRDFNYSSDGTVQYVTALNPRTQEFLDNIDLPVTHLPSDGSLALQPQYWQAFLALAGEAGFTGRRVDESEDPKDFLRRRIPRDYKVTFRLTNREGEWQQWPRRMVLKNLTSNDHETVRRALQWKYPHSEFHIEQIEPYVQPKPAPPNMAGILVPPPDFPVEPPHLAEPGGVDEAEDPKSVLRAASASRTPEMVLLNLGFKRKEDSNGLVSFYKKQARTTIQIAFEPYDQWRWITWGGPRHDQWRGATLYKEWQNVINRLGWELMEAEDPKSVFKKVTADSAEYRLRQLVSTDRARFASVDFRLNAFYLSIETMMGHVVMDIGPFRPDQLYMFRDEWYGFKDTTWEGWHKAMREAGIQEAEDPKSFLKRVAPHRMSVLITHLDGEEVSIQVPVYVYAIGWQMGTEHGLIVHNFRNLVPPVVRSRIGLQGHDWDDMAQALTDDLNSEAPLEQNGVFTGECHIGEEGEGAIFCAWQFTPPPDVRAWMLRQVEDEDEVGKRLAELYPEPQTESKADDIAKEAEKAEQPKSQEQADAGNQKKGHIHLHGWAIAIENGKGSVRKSKDPENPWQVTMPAHYGYIKGTEGKDKDHIDVYIGEHPTSMLAFVVNQVKKEGGAFDEHKIMLGFKSKDEAIATYDAAFNGDLGPKLRKSVVSATIDQVKAWLEKGDTKKEYANLEEAEDPKAAFKTFPRHEWAYTVNWAPERDKAQVLITHGPKVVNSYVLRKDEEEFEDWDSYPDSLGQYWTDWYRKLDVILPYRPEDWETFLDWYEKAYHLQHKKSVGESEDPKAVFKKLPREDIYILIHSLDEQPIQAKARAYWTGEGIYVSGQNIIKALYEAVPGPAEPHEIYGDAGNELAEHIAFRLNDGVYYGFVEVGGHYVDWKLVAPDDVMDYLKRPDTGEPDMVERAAKLTAKYQHFDPEIIQKWDGEPPDYSSIAQESKSEALALIEAEDPKSFLKRVAPHPAWKDRVVKILVTFRDGNAFERRCPVTWEKDRVMKGDGWYAGIDLHDKAPKLPYVDDDTWEDILSTVEYHIMDGPPDPDGMLDYDEVYDPEDADRGPVRSIEWKYIGNYEADQESATKSFGGVTPHAR